MATKVVAVTATVGLDSFQIKVHNSEQNAVYYASRSLTGVERRYFQTEKETLLVYGPLRDFTYTCMCMAKNLSVFSDQKPLKYTSRSNLSE